METSAENVQEATESSSGFGSRNTTSQNTQSSSSHSRTALMDASMSPASGLHQPPRVPSPLARPLPQPLDISADDHYEFDPILHVDSAVESGGRGGGFSDSEILNISRSSPGTTKVRRSVTPPPPEDVEARLRAMREEFHLYRQRQAQRRRGPVLESAC
jgi:hypothetical protein